FSGVTSHHIYDTSHPQFSPLSLHDALPILASPPRPLTSTDYPSRPPKIRQRAARSTQKKRGAAALCGAPPDACAPLCFRTGSRRSEEHTSELQSRENLVCRLLLEKKKHQLL